MNLDRDRLVEWLSAPAAQMQEGATAFLWAIPQKACEAFDKVWLTNAN